MILICKHGHRVVAQLNWDGWWESMYTSKPGDQNGLSKLKPVGVSREEFNKKEFVGLTGCPHCQWIEVENN